MKADLNDGERVAFLQKDGGSRRRRTSEQNGDISIQAGLAVGQVVGSPVGFYFLS